MNVWISCNTLLVHQVTKLSTKSWKSIEQTNGLTIVTSRLFLKLHARSKKTSEQVNLRASSPGLSRGGATKEGLLAG